MRKYTTREKKILEKNPYTYKVTDHHLKFTAEFKREFWRKYEAGEAPRTILAELGYDIEMFGSKQIDSIVQLIKKQAASGMFRDGSTRERGGRGIKSEPKSVVEPTPENMTRMWNELLYLRQEVDAMKRLRPAEALVKGTSR